MIHIGRSVAFAGVLLVAGLARPVHAFDLTGAWSTNPELCSHIFTRKGSEVNFSELSDLYGSGFVIDGSRIKGKAASCTITSQKQDGDLITLSATCATEIMKQNTEFSVKVIDDRTIARLFPDIPNMAVSYSRCKP